MNKKIIILLVFTLLLAGFVYAVQDLVMVLNLNYDGNITLLDSTIKYGFYPDRRIQPDFGIFTRIYADEEILYEFTIANPNQIIVEGTDEFGNLSGGIILLEELEFSIIVPYFSEMTKIEFVENQKKVGILNFQKEKSPVLLILGLILIPIIIVVLILIINLHSRKKSNS